MNQERTLGTVLVTGGAGFIGTTLATRIGQAATRWVVLDNLHPQVHATEDWPTDLPDLVERHRGDVTDPTAWDRLLADVRPDTVVHLAAETGTAQSLTESTRHSMVNVVGTTTMLDAFGRHEHTPRHVLLTSSRAVYGEGTWRTDDGRVFRPGTRTHAQLEAGQWDHTLDGARGHHEPNRADETLPSPTSVYGATKLAQEHILSAWTSSHDVDLSVLRLQNVYGPGQSLTNPYTGIVSLFSQLARDGRSIPLYEDGEITRDFVYIDDVVSALVAALRRPTGQAPLLGDVGTGVRTTIRQLAEAIATYHDAPAPHVTGQYRDGDVRHASCSLEATAAALDWQPAWSLDDGVAGLQTWIAGQLDG
jgi:dTDP-L-rhamnose 4-epimerase